MNQPGKGKNGVGILVNKELQFTTLLGNDNFFDPGRCVGIEIG